MSGFGRLPTNLVTPTPPLMSVSVSKSGTVETSRKLLEEKKIEHLLDGASILTNQSTDIPDRQFPKNPIIPSTMEMKTDPTIILPENKFLDEKSFVEKTVQNLSNGKSQKMEKTAPIPLKCGDRIGSGAYGIVYRAHDPTSGKEVAVKRNIVDSRTDFSGSLRELDIQARLRKHPFILQIVELSIGSPFDKIPNQPIEEPDMKNDALHFIFEYGHDNLHNLIYKRNLVLNVDLPGKGPTQIPLDSDHLLQIMVQILLGLEYIHSRNVIHRDLKPSNILIFNSISNDNIRIVSKIGDFGISRVQNDQEPMSPRMATSWYRAPEICLGYPHYTTQADMWSFGCLIFEMISRQAFLRGIADDDKAILREILTKLPVKPTQKDVDEINTTQRYTIDTAIYQPGQVVKPTSWAQLLGMNDNQIKQFNKKLSYNNGGHDTPFQAFCDLLSNLLVFNPKKRFTAQECLKHRFFHNFVMYIISIRQTYPPKHITPGDYLVTIRNCPERKQAATILMHLFQNRQRYEWYRPAIIFQAMDIFDRYLVWAYINKPKEAQEVTYGGLLMHQDKVGKTENSMNLDLRILGCLYMAIKYLTTSICPCTFWDLTEPSYRNKTRHEEADLFERLLFIKVLDFAIFRPTIFEVNPIRFDNSKQIQQILQVYFSLESTTIKLSDLVQTVNHKAFSELPRELDQSSTGSTDSSNTSTFNPSTSSYTPTSFHTSVPSSYTSTSSPSNTLVQSTHTSSTKLPLGRSTHPISLVNLAGTIGMGNSLNSATFFPPFVQTIPLKLI